MKKFLFTTSFFLASLTFADERMLPLYLIQTGRVEQALEIYLSNQSKDQSYDSEILQGIGLALLQKGQESQDPESQLLAIYGAGVSLNEHTLPIIENGMKSPFPQIQLVSLQLLAKYQNDLLTPAIMQAMRSDSLLVRFEAASLLATLKSTIASSQILSLMLKVDDAALPLFAPLLVKLGTKEANTQLRKFLTHSNEEIRLAALLSIQEAGRDDYLPDVKRLSLQPSPIQQEACAAALGALKDGLSIPYLEQLASSPHTNVSLAANYSLYRLGKKEACKNVIWQAKEENLFAISLLGQMKEGKECLLSHLKSKSAQVRVNAALALLEHENPACLPILSECLATKHLSYGLIKTLSPGKCLTAWKLVPIPPGSDEDPMIEEILLSVKEGLLQKASCLPEKDYLKLAKSLFLAKENGLVPSLCASLESLNTKDAILLLKEQKQQVGAPLIRLFCTLSLFRLGEDDQAAAVLQNFLASKQAESLILLRPTLSGENEKKGSFQLTAKEESRLLVETIEAFASKQEDLGIEVLIKAIKNGHPKNRYALAGLLMRAAQ